jgi:hypothetical protein
MMPHFPAVSTGLGEEIDELMIVTTIMTNDEWSHDVGEPFFTEGIRLRLEGLIRIPKELAGSSVGAEVRTAAMESYNKILAKLEDLGIQHAEPPTFEMNCSLLKKYEEGGKKVHLINHMARVEFVFFRATKDMVNDD